MTSTDQALDALERRAVVTPWVVMLLAVVACVALVSAGVLLVTLRKVELGTSLIVANTSPQAQARQRAATEAAENAIVCRVVLGDQQAMVAVLRAAAPDAAARIALPKPAGC